MFLCVNLVFHANPHKGVCAFFHSVLLFFEDCFFKYIFEKNIFSCYSEKNNMDSHIVTFDFNYMIKISKVFPNLLIREPYYFKTKFCHWNFSLDLIDTGNYWDNRHWYLLGYILKYDGLTNSFKGCVHWMCFLLFPMYLCFL